MHKKTIVKVALESVGVLVGLGAFGVANAADFDFTGLYVSANGGVAQIDNSNAYFENLLIQEASSGGTLEFTQHTLHKRNPAGFLDVGYMLWDYVGIQASYFHFGHLYYQALGTYAPITGSVETVGAATRINSEGPALGVLLRLPLFENFAVTLRASDYYGRSTLENILNAASYVPSKSVSNQSSFLFGAGAAFTVGGHWSARMDYTRARKVGTSSSAVSYNVDMASVGLSYTF